jgi:hypothetical protein
MSRFPAHAMARTCTQTMRRHCGARVVREPKKEIALDAVKQRPLTQQQLAHRLGISPILQNHVECGRADMPEH